MQTEHCRAIRMITLQHYPWKGTKWAGEIKFQDFNELGFWEKREYSNSTGL